MLVPTEIISENDEKAATPSSSPTILVGPNTTCEKGLGPVVGRE